MADWRCLSLCAVWLMASCQVPDSKYWLQQFLSQCFLANRLRWTYNSYSLNVPSVAKLCRFPSVLIINLHVRKISVQMNRKTVTHIWDQTWNVNKFGGNLTHIPLFFKWIIVKLIQDKWHMAYAMNCKTITIFNYISQTRIKRIWI